MKGMFMFAQAEAPATTTVAEAAPAAGTEAAAAPAAAPKQGGFGMFVPMLVIFAIFYFMMIRPQQRKEKERRKMIEELRVGAKVVFAQGLVGTIVEANERTFRIRTAESEVEVLRSAVADVFTEKQAEPAAK